MKFNEYLGRWVLVSLSYGHHFGKLVKRPSLTGDEFYVKNENTEIRVFNFQNLSTEGELVIIRG